MKLKKQSVPTTYRWFFQFLLIPLFMAPQILLAQGGNQWTTSVNVAGVDSLADWVYDVITTSEKNYFAVGFAKEDEYDTTPRPDVPAYFLLSPNGTLMGDGFIEIPSLENAANTARGRLFNVVEGENAYFAVGCIDCFIDSTRGFWVKIDKTSLDEQHRSLKPTGYNRGRLSDIILASNGTENHLIGFGWGSR